MGKTVILAEKPSVGKEIARVLGGGKNSDGCIISNKYIVTWALGHLVTLADPEAYGNQYKAWSFESLPMIPEKMKLTVIKESAKQFYKVQDILKRNDVSELVIATDAGREGELVARWIIIKCGFKKPIRRLWISSQTDKAIKEGFNKLRPGAEYDHLYLAAKMRAEADWLVGLNITRALTCKFNAQLSAGRVQTPTLAMIVRREEEIKRFKPQPYYTITAAFDGFSAEYKDGRISDKEKAQSILNKVKNSKFILANSKKDLKSEGCPLLYDLTELQRDANTRYAYSAKQTLSIMQRLYEYHKVLTYPRTDSKYLSTDIVPTLKERLRALPPHYQSYVNQINRNKSAIHPKCVNDKMIGDHHAIIPTEQYVDFSALSTEERCVYDLVAKRFLSVFFGDAKSESVAHTFKCAGELFVAKGRRVISPGWREVYGKEQDAREIIPALTAREYVPKRVEITEGKTKPKSRYTEADLLSAMEHAGRFVQDEKMRGILESAAGLGTPATRADIIERLFSAAYCERSGKEIVPTPKGIQLIGLVPEDLREPELTAKWERQLDLISKGKMGTGAFEKEIKKYAAHLVSLVKSSEAKYTHHNLTGTPCPECGKYLLSVNGKKGKLLVCQDRECGYRQHLTTVTNARCPECHKKMSLTGKDDKALFICICGFRERKSAFLKRLEQIKNTANKYDVQNYMKNQKTEDVESPLALALKKAMEEKKK